MFQMPRGFEIVWRLRVNLEYEPATLSCTKVEGMERKIIYSTSLSDYDSHLPTRLGVDTEDQREIILLRRTLGTSNGFHYLFQG